MNVNDGHLVKLKSLENELSGNEDYIKHVKELKEEQRGHLKKVAKAKGYEPVPERMQDQAEKELDGKDETHVDLEGDSDLAKWANMKRESKKRKNRRKMAKASKRTNRK